MRRVSLPSPVLRKHSCWTNVSASCSILMVMVPKEHDLMPGRAVLADFVGSLCGMVIALAVLYALTPILGNCRILRGLSQVSDQ